MGALPNPRVLEPHNTAGTISRCDGEDTKPLVKPLSIGLALAVVVMVVCEFFKVKLIDDAGDAQVTANIVAERACIAQFSASEFWLKHQHVYECVTASREIPSSILTHPLKP